MILKIVDDRHFTHLSHNGIKVATIVKTTQYHVARYRVEMHIFSNFEKVFYGYQNAMDWVESEFKQFIQQVNGASERRFLFINPVSTCFMNSFTPESDWIDGCIVVDLFESRITFDGETWEEIQ